MNREKLDEARISWFDLREKYQDEKIYPSQSKSIIENFNQRLFSQDRINKDNPFPIKLIRSIYTNVCKIKEKFPSEESVFEILKEAEKYRNELENAIDNCVGRILIPVNESNEINDCSGENIWKYPIEEIKSIGFDPVSGGIYIKLFRSTDNIRRMYGYNEKISSWEPVKEIKTLRELHIHHEPPVQDILEHSYPDLIAMKTLGKIDISLEDLNVKNYIQKKTVWNKIIPLLDTLLKNVLIVLAQYQLSLVPNYLHSHR